MGALTSKPYAFTARPWELRSREAVDYFDSFGSSIRIDLRGLDIMRVLPSINEAVNEEWITDKVRFSYDGLKRQRLVAPLIRSGLSFIKVGWFESYVLLFKRIFLNSSSSSINFFIGKLVDINSFYSLISFFQRLKQLTGVGTNLFYAEDPYLSMPRRYRTQYLFPALKHVDQIDILLLIGSNIRLESPLLNIRIRKRALTYNLPVFTLGFQSDLTYNVVNLGGTVATMLSLVEGRHPFLKLWLRKIAPSFFFSHSVNRLRLNQLISSFKCVSDQFVSVYQAFIALSGSTSTIFDYGVLSSFHKARNLDFNWVLNNDEICFEEGGFTVYSGHHGDRNALLSDLIIPLSLSNEKNTAYMNMSGLYQQSNFVLNPPNLVRSEFHFVNSFFFFAKAMLGLSTNQPISLSSNFFKHYFVRFMGYAFSSMKLGTHSTVAPFIFTTPTVAYSSALNSPISSFMESYYLDNQITRASHVMALAQTRFKRYVTNFK